MEKILASSEDETIINQNPTETSSGEALTTDHLSADHDMSTNEEIPPLVELVDITQDSGVEMSVDSIDEAIAKHCVDSGIVNPVEILRYFQKEFVTGRELDISDTTQVSEGPTNYICVDRHNILKTSLDEIKELTNRPKKNFTS